MPQRVMDDDDDDWEEEGDDDEEPDYEALLNDDEPTVPCPYCQCEIPEDTPHCPYCNHYLSAEDAPPARRPLWIVLTAVICLIIVILWVRG